MTLISTGPRTSPSPVAPLGIGITLPKHRAVIPPRAVRRILGAACENMVSGGGEIRVLCFRCGRRGGWTSTAHVAGAGLVVATLAPGGLHRLGPHHVEYLGLQLHSSTFSDADDQRAQQRRHRCERPSMVHPSPLTNRA